uniref:Ig-like domain-containing protein n=1 Tax=Anolis carolinensis TaxID=28377 RepID=H9GTZ5_ANOCA
MRESQERVMFGCLLTGFPPEVLDIIWEPDGDVKTHFPPVIQDGKKAYSVSKMTVAVSKFLTTPYTCRVKHSTGSKENGPSATIRYKDCMGQSPKPVQVHILTPNCGEQETEASLELVCLLRSLGPGKASVEWLINGEVEPKKVEAELTADKDNGFSSFVRRNISKDSWENGDRYTCKVTRPLGSQNVTMYNTSKCQACSMRQPIISITKPSYRNLLEGTASVTCSVVGSNLGNIQIIWHVDGKPSPHAQGPLEKKEANGNQNVISTHPVSMEQWKKGTTFSCEIGGHCYENDFKDIIIKNDTNTIKPSVAISRAPLDISLKNAVALILICDVSGFFPKEISISWKKNGMPLNETLYNNGMAKAAGNVYTTYSILTIGRDEPGGKGGSYSCVVHHSSSDKPITTSENVPMDFFEPKAPLVELLQSIDQKEKTVMLKCMASNYRPSKVSIRWKSGPQNRNEASAEQAMSDGTYRASSQFQIPISQWKSVESNTCEVVHKETNFTVVKKTTRKDWIVPTALTLSLSTTPFCHSTGLENRSSIILFCSVHGYSLEKMQITWEIGGKVQQDSKAEAYQQSEDQFYTTSNLTLSLKEWNKLQEYTCKVTQPEAKHIQTAHISKCTACKDSIPPPSLYLLKPPLKMLLTQGKALLTCLAVGYELEHAMLTWMVNDHNHTKDARTENIESHTNWTQSLKSHLNITSQVWGSGSNVQCIISHPCALFPDTKQSIQKYEDSSPIKEPTLSLITPSATQLMQPSTQAVAWLACVISGFSPAEILVWWKKNNRDVVTSEYITGPPVVETGSSTFTTQSILKVPASEWENRALYTCVVGHESLSDLKNISRTLYDLLEPASPEVVAFHSSEDREGQKLVCFATNFYPQNIDIQWYIKGNLLNCSADSSTLVPLANGKFQKSCDLLVSGEEWSKPEIYTCTVNHSATTSFVKKDLHSSGMVSTLNNETAIKMKLPSFEELFMNKSAAVTCMMQLVNRTTNATFSWAMDGESVNANAVATEVLEESNSTSWLYSKLWLNLTEWNATTEFTCSISDGPTETKFRRNGTIKPPKVYLHHQQSSEDSNVTLLCMAKDFYPGEIFLEWKEENKEMSLKGHNAHDLKCDHKKQKCSLMSILEVPTSKWMTGITYTCLVAHISSENITARRASSLSDTWDCAIMGAAVCDVRNENEDEYSELEDANGVWNKVSTFMVLFVVALFYGGLVTFIKVK